MSSLPGNFVRRRTDTAKSGLAAQRTSGYGRHAAPVFPGAVQTWPRSGGAFFLRGPPRREYPAQCEI
ncbi:hypothetical protein B5K11_13575 [Rhizobium leguminosarum bv. trifolii]|nr:hypothetical protein B5K11_13575 [Rhizobium leguminosarum bv. trifolii]